MRRSYSILAWLVLVALILPVPARAQVDQGTFVFATIQEPSTLDPAVVYDGSDRITRLVYEGLLQYKGTTSQVAPALAESWTSTQAKVYTFKLRRGVTFHDGTRFDADAVKYSFTRMLKIGKGMAWAFKMVLDEKGIEVIDKYTIRFTLKSPYPAFPAMLASRYAAPIISPGVVKHAKSGDLAQAWAKENTVGTGPYRLVRWIRKQEVVLEKNPTYWRGWQGKHFTRVVEKIVPDASAQRLMLEKGEVHSATHISIDDLIELRKNPKIRVFVSKPEETNFNFFVLMNTRKGPFSDIRVRQALSYAFPYKDTAQHMFRGLATVARGPVPVGVVGHNPGGFQYTTDMAKAKQLMAEAMYPNGGFTVRIVYMSGQDWMTRILTVLTATLKSLGVNTQVQGLTWDGMVAAITKRDTIPDLAIGDWWDDYPDPDSFLGGQFGTLFWGGKELEDRMFHAPEIKKLLGQATFEPDPQKRLQMYYTAQEMIVKQVPAVWVLDLAYTTAMLRGLKGYVFNPYYSMTYNVYDMWMEKE